MHTDDLQEDSAVRKVKLAAEQCQFIYISVQD